MSEKHKYVKIPEPIIFMERSGKRSQDKGIDLPPHTVLDWLYEFPFNHPKMGLGVVAQRTADRMELAFSGEPGTYAKLMIGDWETLRDAVNDWPIGNMIRLKQQRPFSEAIMAAVDEDPVEVAAKAAEEAAKKKAAEAPASP